jgi:hypothetical protein
VLLGDDLKEKYPEFITLVLQNSFRDLHGRRDGVSVILTFSGVERMIGFPYDAVVRIAIPEIGVTIALEPAAAKESFPQKGSAEAEPIAAPERGGNKPSRGSRSPRRRGR